jgi:hypothetical protein
MFRQFLSSAILIFLISGVLPCQDGQSIIWLAERKPVPSGSSIMVNGPDVNITGSNAVLVSIYIEAATIGQAGMKADQGDMVLTFLGDSPYGSYPFFKQVLAQPVDGSVIFLGVVPIVSNRIRATLINRKGVVEDLLITMSLSPRAFQVGTQGLMGIGIGSIELAPPRGRVIQKATSQGMGAPPSDPPRPPK